MMLEATQILPLDCELGEGVMWDAKRQLVWFVDIKKHLLWRFDPATGESASTTAPDQIGWVVDATDGRLLAGLKDGLYVFDVERDAFSKLTEVPGEPSHNRLNDACSHPDGVVFFGSMDDGEDRETGRFYRFRRGVVEPVGPDRISITNGPAVSPDGRKIYFTDTRGKTMMVADIAADGSIGPARLFADTSLDFPDAYPDGPVVDSEGCVWTGLWNGGAVARYSQEGRLLSRVAVPAANVTKMTFGGPDLKTAFITTARAGLDEAALAAQPMAGSLFTFRSDIAGYPQTAVEL
ncbi:MAG: SMP-30/gluconolactonase/LRE family protein [Caulobacteraceae bacterium]